MGADQVNPQSQRFLQREQLQQLLDQIIALGYELYGPQVRDGAVVLDRLQQVDQLPVGVVSEQSPARYRLHKGNHSRYFDYAATAQGLKPWLFKPEENLWRMRRDTQGHLHFDTTLPRNTRRAFLGVRACDLAGLALQDQHFLASDGCDPHYQTRRSDLLLIAVTCTISADSCFCAATGDGPKPNDGYDVQLTELDDGFLCSSLNDAGHNLLSSLDTSLADKEHINEANKRIVQAVANQQRHLPDTQTVYQRLSQGGEHPRWQEIARRCLSCGNCTAVCPSCFCHRQRDVAELRAESEEQHSEHIREWDSCFNPDHSYIHGITLRADIASRYRQWLTHKLAWWQDQYGRMGCSGCGRCITWCPAAIDITEEVEALTP